MSNNISKYKLFISSLNRKQKADRILAELDVKSTTDHLGYSWAITIPEITYEKMQEFNRKMGIDEDQMYVCYHE